MSKNHGAIVLSVEFDRIEKLLKTTNWTGRDSDRQVWMRKLVEVQKALVILNKNLPSEQRV